MTASGRTKRWLAALAGASVLVTTAGTGAAGAGPVTAPTPLSGEADVSADVRSEIEEQGRADFWVRLEERADLAAPADVQDWAARGQAVYDALTRTAEDSQQTLRAELDASGVAYTPFFITNAVLVRAGDAAVLNSVAALPEVEGIYPTTSYQPPDPKRSESADVGPAAVEWGIADIQADQVWDGLGVLGENIVVANLDTGVDYTHPALVNQYRGNNGDGSFSHDYNWFDGSGAFPDEPGDYDGHGTHTAGTMVGDDGGDNQIGVAPGARWIAAGTDWTDASLFAAGEWFLAPTTLTGDNPDPALRPHVINNSWGVPMETDPFMEDILAAWEASGMFGVWAAGNEGEFGCETLRSPPLMQMTYAVGAYDSSRQISFFSSRGPGQDGEIKPNIAAPGEGVRSSVPGNGYAYSDGTSMAAPHVAGSVALMWSASPALVGDIDGTKTLLDDTAGDAPDDECGGTDDDNNVYGEGRLDALELVLAAPTGDVGTLEGVATDAASGDPIPGVRVSISGPLDRTLTTGPDGSYRARVLAGDYTVTAAKFGWVEQTATVTVPTDGTATLDFELDQAPTGTVSGTVTDGSGHGFPLYARVSVSGTTLATYTDPETGGYSLDLPLDTYAILLVDVQYPGYQQGFREVQLSGDAVEDFAVPVDSFTCVANGYSVSTDGQTETFDSATVPAGWSVEDYLGNDQVWRFDDPAGRGNLTGGEGGFAIVDSDWYGPEGAQDTALVSPSYDLSGMTNPTLGFRHYYEPLGEVAALEVSTDGGTSWDALVQFGPAYGVEEIVGLPAEPDVRFRFHYFDASYAWFWQVDDVFVGERACEPDVAGGYVVGNVSAAATGEPVSGATVTSLDAPGDRGISRDTPADENLDDGFYWLFSTLTGTHPFEAAARRMEPQVQDVTVPADDAVRADFELGAGLLVTDPDEITTEVVLGGSATEELTITNTGDGTAEVVLQEQRGDFEMLRADGTSLTAAEARAMPGAPERRIAVEPSVSAFGAGPGRADGERLVHGPAEEPWTEVTPYPTPIMDNRVVTLDGAWYSIGGTDGWESLALVHRYDPEAMEWAEVAPLPAPASAVTAGVVGGQLVVSGGWGADGSTTAATFVYDTAGDTWAPVSDSPWAVSAAGQAVAEGLLFSVGGCSTGDCVPMSSDVSAYDPATDTWVELAPYPEPVAFPSCGGIAGTVYCTGGVNEASDLSATYAYDLASDTWSEVAEGPTSWWGSSYAVANGQLVVTGGIQGGAVSNEAYAYDPALDAWEDLPNPNSALYRGGAGCGFARVGGDQGGFVPVDTVEYLPGYDDCGSDGADVTWLSLSETEQVLQPGESWTVEVTTDGAVPQPGTYTAGVAVTGGMPGTDPTVPVTMVVTPPNAWGKVMGTVSGESCEGQLDPLPGAAVTMVPTAVDNPRWYLVTDADGGYARWIDTRVGELEMTAFQTGFYPETVFRTIPRGVVTEQDFALLDAACEVPTPVHPQVERIAGADRYETAAMVARRFDPGVHTVFVATGARFPDALTAAARAGSLDSPVLLTRTDLLTRVTRDELIRLRPERVVVLGDEASVQAPVLTAIRAAVGGATPVVRWAGTDRYATAALVAQDFPAADVVYVATGEDFPDALAGSARAGALDAPVLLVKEDAVPSATRTELTRLDPTEIRVLGGPDTVSDTVLAQLGGYGPVIRIHGPDRYATAVALSQDLVSSEQAFVANGSKWPDAVAAAALAAREEAPVLLVKATSVPSVTWTELDRLDPGRVWVMGDHLTVDDEVVERLRTLE